MLVSIVVAWLVIPGAAQAIPNPNIAPAGSFNTSLAGDLLTVIFDEPVTGDVDGNADGLLFDLGGGLELTVTSNVGFVRMDDPANGGLGVDGGAGDPGDDNMTCGAVCEELTFTFNQTIDLVSIMLNGLRNSPENGHTDAADGSICISGVLCSSAAQFDGVGADFPNDLSTLPPFIFNGAGITSFTVAATNMEGNDPVDPFSGYVEAITVRAQVPEPSTLMLLSIGLLGIFFGGRRKRQI